MTEIRAVELRLLFPLQHNITITDIGTSDFDVPIVSIPSILEEARQKNNLKAFRNGYPKKYSLEMRTAIIPRFTLQQCDAIAHQVALAVIKRRSYLRKWASFEYLGMYFRGLRSFPKSEWLPHFNIFMKYSCGDIGIESKDRNASKDKAFFDKYVYTRNYSHHTFYDVATFANHGTTDVFLMNDHLEVSPCNEFLSHIKIREDWKRKH